MEKIDWYGDFNKYYNEDILSLINKHHFNSYDDFLKNRIKSIIYNDYFKIESSNKVIQVTFENLDFKLPTNDNNEPLMPNECRLKNLSYLLKVMVTANIEIKKEAPIKIHDVVLFEVPIMVLSKYCNLYKKIEGKDENSIKSELYKYGECINELGGYFIINGKEKLIVSQERLAYNKLYTHTSRDYELITEVKSARRNSFIPARNTYVKIKQMKSFKKKLNINQEFEEDKEDKENKEDTEMASNVFMDGDNDSKTSKIKRDDLLIYVSFPGVGDIPLFIIFRALGIESDKEIYNYILKDLLPYNYFDENTNTNELFNNYDNNNDKYSEFFNFLETSRIDSCPIYDKMSAIDFIYKRLDDKLKKTIFAVQDKVEKKKRVYQIIFNNLLPHQPTAFSKAMYLGYMVYSQMKVYMGYDNISNRDTYEFKQIETSGYLLSTLLREYYVKFQRHAISLLTTKTNQTQITNQIRESYIANNNQQFKLLFTIERNKNIITEGINRGFKGNWGVRDVQKTVTIENLHERINRDQFTFSKEGLVQDLLRISYLSTITHLRRVQTPMDSNVKIVGPRKLNATQWGYVCPVDTPDGGNSGLIKNFSIGCNITENDSTIYDTITRIFMKTSGFYSYLDKYVFKPNLYCHNIKIFVDGVLIGIYTNNNIEHIIKLLRLGKRNNIFNNKISIAFSYENKELYILTDFGRCVRPVYVVEYDNSSSKYNILRTNIKKDISWEGLISGVLEQEERVDILELYKNDLNTLNSITINKLEDSQGSIEFIDPNESLYTLICMSLNDINTTSNTNYKYLEIDGKFIFGALPSIIPFMNHNPYTRNLFCMAQSKQAVGIPFTNYNKRMDTFTHVLYYPQSPLVNTKISNNIKYNHMPGGCNVVIAIMTYTGYNQEDAIIINKSSLDKGLFGSAYYRTYIEYESETENFSVPDIDSRKSGYNYNKLENNGIIKNNTYVTDNDIIIGKVSEIDNKLVDTSTSIHHHDFGVVDGIYSHQSDDSTNFCKIRIRMERTPQFADKFGSRHGLKGVVGMLINQEDMPFTQDGIVPDIIINPHGVPSRMSTGHLIECITGKMCSLLGNNYDASPFENDNELENITAIMENLDYEMYGNEVMYNGYTGEQINSNIFIGCQFYQRLKHMVHDKVQSRDTGPKTLLERQPAHGRAREGGLRIGEMERDSLISHGLASFIKESYTKRSDDYKCHICKMCGRIATVNEKKNIHVCNFCKNQQHFSEVRMPYCAKLFIQEMESQSVCMRLITK